PIEPRPDQFWGEALEVANDDCCTRVFARNLTLCRYSQTNCFALRSLPAGVGAFPYLRHGSQSGLFLNSRHDSRAQGLAGPSPSARQDESPEMGRRISRACCNVGVGKTAPVPEFPE